jgi:hypothetical protein
MLGDPQFQKVIGPSLLDSKSYATCCGANKFTIIAIELESRMMGDHLVRFVQLKNMKGQRLKNLVVYVIRLNAFRKKK